MRILLLILGLCLHTLAQAQDPSTGFSNRMGEHADRGPSLAKIEEKGYQALKEGDEYLAMEYFYRVVSIDTNRVASLRGYGKAAMMHGAFGRAKWAWQRLLAIDSNDEAAKMNLAETLYKEGAYEQAQEVYQQILGAGSAEAKEKAERSIEQINWAIQLRDKSDFSKEAILLDSSINTEYSEYMNWPSNDGVFYFSSYRFPFKRGDFRDRRPRRLIKILQATPSSDTFSTRVIDFGEKKKHILHPTFNEAGDQMYYAQGEFINSAEIRCDLYRRYKKGMEWGAPENLGKLINLKDYTATEPNIARLPGDANETLFFVSDRPGGKGGRDIWYATIFPDGTIGAPVNLEAINTPEDDVTPFYHSATGTLYFSTIGQQTMGGFDVFKSVGNPGAGWTAPEHLAPPVNSSANDVFFSLTTDGTTAYMSSNRFGSANISEEACCYDIFQVPVVKPKMLAVAFRADTKDSLIRTNMRLYELRDKKLVLVDSAMNIPGAYYPFAVSPGKTYIVIADKPGFEPDTVQFITPRTVWPGVMAQHLFLKEIKVDLVARVFDKKTKEPIQGASARFIDMGPANAPPGEVAGKSLVNVNTVGNDFKYTLEVNRIYKVLISKNGYTTDSVMVSTAGINQTTTLYKDLYLERGINLEALVFDNTFRNPAPVSGVRFELYDVAKDREPILVASELRELDNQFSAVLEYGHRYKIVATKPKFSSDTIIFNVPALTNKPFDVIRQRLEIHSLELEKYLPIRLYFDNDEPNKRTMAVTTDKLFSQTYFAYYPKKDTFISVYTSRMVGAEKEQAIKDLEAFFEDSLKGEWNRLRFFTEVLFDKLKRGDHVEISIMGFASPRASAVYNKNLTSRRIISVMNHFRDFDGALLSKYISTGQLVVKEVPNGESLARPGVNDKYNDPRNSVFSPGASKERRVEIVEIEFNVIR